MIASGYTADLYCENADPDSPGFRKTCPRRWGSFPDTYCGETEGECFRQARRGGWLIGRDRRAYCPLCSGKRGASKKGTV